MLTIYNLNENKIDEIISKIALDTLGIDLSGSPVGIKPELKCALKLAYNAGCYDTKKEFLEKSESVNFIDILNPF